MPVNLNQYQATMEVFNNRNSAQCNSYNIGYNQSFQNCSNFIVVSVIFICLVYLFTLTVYFNAKSSNWYKHDTTTYEGSKIDAITSQFGLKQLIQEQTHILTDSSSCIDLILTSQPNLVMGSGVHSSLHQNCHH